MPAWSYTGLVVRWFADMDRAGREGQRTQGDIVPSVVFAILSGLCRANGRRFGGPIAGPSRRLAEKKKRRMLGPALSLYLPATERRMGYVKATANGF